MYSSDRDSSTTAALISLRIAMSALLGLSAPPSLAVFATSPTAAPAGHSAPLRPGNITICQSYSGLLIDRVKFLF